eukprot:364283-Chlamydomonas_euryale.AAC.15
MATLLGVCPMHPRRQLLQALLCRTAASPTSKHTLQALLCRTAASPPSKHTLQALLCRTAASPPSKHTLQRTSLPASRPSPVLPNLQCLASLVRSASPIFISGTWPPFITGAKPSVAYSLWTSVICSGGCRSGWPSLMQCLTLTSSAARGPTPHSFPRPTSTQHSAQQHGPPPTACPAQPALKTQLSSTVHPPRPALPSQHSARSSAALCSRHDRPTPCHHAISAHKTHRAPRPPHRKQNAGNRTQETERRKPTSCMHLLPTTSR